MQDKKEKERECVSAESYFCECGGILSICVCGDDALMHVLIHSACFVCVLFLYSWKTGSYSSAAVAVDVAAFVICYYLVCESFLLFFHLKEKMVQK